LKPASERITAVVTHQPKEDSMAKGQMRSNKEKKKPKADKSKKQKGTPSYLSTQTAAASPFAKKT
jgi:hypothetical protein